MHKVTLYLPEGTWRRLVEMSKRTGRPQAALVRQALDWYLAMSTIELPRSIGAGADPDLSGEESEDWLLAQGRPD
jgi:hypothetical protein